MDASDNLNKLALLVLVQNQAIKDFLNKIRGENNIRILLKYNTIRIPVKIITESIINWTDESDEIKNIKADPEFNQFILLIFNAIIESPEIRGFIDFLSRENHLEPLMGSDIEIITKHLINLIISGAPTDLENLENRRRVIIRREEKLQEPPRELQYIDGIPLTENEEIFEEYCAAHFITRWWMKKNRLTWESKKPKKDKT